MWSCSVGTYLIVAARIAVLHAASDRTPRTLTEGVKLPGMRYAYARNLNTDPDPGCSQLIRTGVSVNFVYTMYS